MKPRKPDRFDQIAVDSVEWHTPSGTPMISSYEVAKLLRKEHAWMRRMVKAHLKLWEGCAPRGYETNQYGRDCRAAQCREILQQLDQRRK